MLIKKYQNKVPVILNLIIVLVYVIALVNGVESRKLDETTRNDTTDEKCTPCGYSSPPPPPPSPPPPPPPANPPPSPSPPPSPKKPPSQYCPPPPPSSFIYITGPPTGNLYPIDQNFSGASSRRNRSFAAFLVPFCVGLLSMVAFW